MSASVKYVEPTDEGVRHVADNMRQEDVVEIWRSNNYRPYECLVESIEVSDRVHMIVIDNEPSGFVGVSSPGLLKLAGIPWMLGTPTLVENARLFIRETRNGINDMMDVYGQLYNYVDADNSTSIRWLKMMGFEIHKAEPFGVHKNLFHKFTKGY